MHLKTALIFLAAHAALAQNAADVFSKAPPDVDDALRARITKFYQAQVEGKGRRAEELVAEDSKDVFYNMGKPKMLSFEIRDITYSENFTKAKAMILVEMYVPMPGFAGKPMKVPGSTTWKIENGLWCWYIDPDLVNATPFGKMKASDNAGTVTAPPDLRNAPTPDSVTNQVRPDKVSVALKAAAVSSDQITIHNGLQGTVRIELRFRPLPGLEIKADRTEIPAGQNALVSFRYEPVKDNPPRQLFVDVGIEPTNALLRFLVSFN